MALEQILGAVSRQTFLDGHYLRLPFSLPGGCKDLVSLGSRPAVEAVLARAEADVLVSRHGQLRDDKPPFSPEQVNSLLESGHTFCVRHAEGQDNRLAELAAGFGRDFLAPIDIHVYWTPSGQPGLGWHYDAEDVFILQTQGAKEWWLRKNTVNPWPLVETLPADMRYEREIMPVLRCRLEAGDWLYIPAGYWHRTEAGEESISLSVGVLSATAVDVYDFLRQRLLPSMLWRQRLPVAGDAATLTEEELVQHYRALFTELGKDLAAQLGSAEAVSAFLAGRRTRFGGKPDNP